VSTISTDNSTGEAGAAAALPRVPLVVRAGQAGFQDYDFLGAGISGALLIGAEQTGGVFSLLEICAEPGAAVPPHRHTREDETFYILEGSFEIQRGEEVIEMAAGMALYGARGVVHAVRCVGPTPGRALILATPGGLETFCRELNDSRSLLSAPGEADFTRLGALMTRYGIEAGPRSPMPKPYGHLAPNRFLGLRNHRGHVLISSDETSGGLVLAGLEVDPKGGLQPHLHRLEEEVFYVLEGHFRVTLGDEEIEALPGDFVFAPRGTVHAWSNSGDSPAYALVFIAPAENFQNFSLEMEKLVAQIGDDVSADDVDPLLLEEIAGLYQRHSIELSHPAEP
jgi:quercetin dioxygenase-like cupin family protein